MQELKSRERMRRRMYSIPAIIFLAIFSVILAKGATKMILRDKESLQKVELLKGEVQASALRKEFLEKSIARLDTPEGVDQEIRAKFGVVLGDERVALIVEERQKASSTEGDKGAWYKKFINVIMRRN